jgi:hypothetical protein
MLQHIDYRFRRKLTWSETFTSFLWKPSYEDATEGRITVLKTLEFSWNLRRIMCPLHTVNAKIRRSDWMAFSSQNIVLKWTIKRQWNIIIRWDWMGTLNVVGRSHLILSHACFVRYIQHVHARVHVAIFISEMKNPEQHRTQYEF